jgi:hypothetical protein
LLLHDAMVEVLSVDGRPMGAGEIAREVNRRGLYIRADGQPVPPNQISARANKYRDLFLKRGGLIELSRAQYTIQSAIEPVVRAVTSPSPADPLWPISGGAFQDIGTIGDLIAKGLPDHDWLGRCGLYAVVVPADYEATFIDEDVVSRAKNVIGPWARERLRAKWVKEARVVYVGLAGRESARCLRDRLRDLLRHCSGRTTDRGPHRGGEILWQLCEYTTFRVLALPTGGPPVPRQMEEGLIEAFRGRYGALPFANRQG